MTPPLNANQPKRSHYEEREFRESLYPTSIPREEGFLKVSPIHNIFYAVYGNPDGIPVAILHGGPGAGCYDTMTRYFDLSRWNVVMFDQRGSMRSTPFGCVEENTPQYSVRDIEALRQYLKIDKWVLFGGSWGSTLALLYGQECPERCIGFILRGVFLARKQDYHHIYYGMGKVFPEAYDPVVQYIPEEERDDLIQAYHRRLFSLDPEEQLAAARIFMKLDAICGTCLPNPRFVKAMAENDSLVLGVAKIFSHYAHNRFFLDPNQILSNMKKIEHLPSIIVHGRWDAICLPEMAYLLYQTWKGSRLWIASNGGHFSSDPSIASALVLATDTFVKEVSIEEKKDTRD